MPLRVGHTKVSGVADSGDTTLVQPSDWNAEHTIIELPTAAEIGAAPSAHVGAGGTAHANATGSVAGFMSAADKTKLDGVASGATANATDSALRDRATHTGTQAASTISDFAEAVDDRVAALLVAGTNVTLTYNDAGNTLTIAATGGGGATDLGIVSAMRAYTNIF
jgi:hypothetical protein